MTLINVTDRAGVLHSFDANDGQSLMENLRDNGFSDILALCGGVMACATCQVYVAPDWADRLSVISEDEDELLDGSGVRRTGSRLSCQICVEPGLSGLDIEIAPPA